MRVISWNMAAGFDYDQDRHHAAWSWLCDQDVDAAILQEVIIPDNVRSEWGSVAFSSKYSRPWGSAVVTREAGYQKWSPTEAHPWLTHLKGAVCLATPDDPAGLWLGSLHSSWDHYERTDLVGLPALEGIALCSTTGLVFEIDVALHELRHVLAGGRFVVGGDLNSSLL